jgi:serine protease inhibitor
MAMLGLGTFTLSAAAAGATAPQAVNELGLDHPFLFAIQHRPSGACLFLGRVTDPR